MIPIRKYPRTRHIEGSRLSAGDEDLSAVPFRELAGKHLVVEEKLDGANAALSFDDDGALLLQSRGHYLSGGPREKHFAVLKTWANAHQRAFAERLGSRYVMYGEWLYAKHTCFYDQLPHYFMEFDVLDRERDAGEREGHATKLGRGEAAVKARTQADRPNKKPRRAGA